MTDAPGGSHGATDPTAAHRLGGRVLTLTLGALGVVFGDIGTSPLYTIKECFSGPHSVATEAGNVYGVLSLVFWSLMIVITIKYHVFIMRADNKGEGGIFALLALVPTARGDVSPKVRSRLVVAALFGAALLYGDGIITPSISVLSAVEGLEVATDALSPAVVPLTCLVLLVLFSFQSKGTHGIGRVFGPVMLVWFATIAILGLVHIVRRPDVFAALSPHHAVRFFVDNGYHGIVVLGSVVLCITGGEAVYADIGHFGSRAIRTGWYFVACPALLLNYFGQGALLLDEPQARTNPFYGLVPGFLLYPMVGLATMAAVIASQALITGAFSLTQQAIQFGFLPRVRIVHTSEETRGQIYISGVNTAMLLACLGLVISFGSSTALAGAYGVAVTAVMGITTVLYYYVISRNWKWPKWKCLALLALFLLFDLSYFGANLLKVVDGGWFPIAVGLGIVAIMTTWRKGRDALAARVVRSSIPIELFIEDVRRKATPRVSGTAVFMSSSATGTPPVLLHHVKHNKVIHNQVVLLSIQTIDVPHVPPEEMLELQKLDLGFYRLTARYGFMATPYVPTIMKRVQKLGLQTEPMETSYFLGRETLLTGGDSGIWRWRKKLFSFLSRNAASPTMWFGLPPGRVVELGMQVDL